MLDKYSLNWNSFQANLSSSLGKLKESEDFCDVTIATDDEQVKAHKVIISTGSSFFKKVLKKHDHSHPLLYLKGVKMPDLRDILTFMYEGKVEVAEDNLAQFLKVANELEILGLANENQTFEFQRRSTNKEPPKSTTPTLPENRPIERKVEYITNNIPVAKHTVDTFEDYEEVPDEDINEPYKDNHGAVVTDDTLDMEIENLNSELKSLTGQDNSDIKVSQNYEIPQVKTENPYLYTRPGPTFESPNLMTDDNRLKCRLCPKSYKNKSDLRDHVKNHSDAFTHACTLCDGKRYKSKNSLRMHINNMHSNFKN